MVQALFALLVCQLAGEVIVRAGDLPVPGPVVGLVLLLGGLLALRRLPGELERASTGLLSHLSLLFVPAGVGVMVHAQRIRADWLPLAAGVVVSTVLTIAVTAVVFRLIERMQQTDRDAQDAGDTP